MSGHSKWSTIKRQKGVADAKRGQLFTKLSQAITIAVKQGGGVTDPNSNFKLRLAMDKGRGANMPKEIIQRAIEKAKGGAGGDMEELVYEGFGPGGVAFIVETVTDNKQRTVSEVKNIFDKNGGNLGAQGSVSYLFKKAGEIVIKKTGQGSDEILDIALDAGVEDMEEGDDVVYLYTDPQNLMNARSVLFEKGLTIDSAELVFKAETTVSVDEEIEKKIFSLLEKLEDLDDVQKVYTNLG
jgi:YebC/PmpR family DNA-binding regulatory protein